MRCPAESSRRPSCPGCHLEVVVASVYGVKRQRRDSLLRSLAQLKDSHQHARSRCSTRPVPVPALEERSSGSFEVQLAAL